MQRSFLGVVRAYKQKAGSVGSQERTYTTVHALMHAWSQEIRRRIVIARMGVLGYLNMNKKSRLREYQITLVLPTAADEEGAPLYVFKTVDKQTFNEAVTAAYVYRAKSGLEWMIESICELKS